MGSHLEISPESPHDPWLLWRWSECHQQMHQNNPELATRTMRHILYRYITTKTTLQQLPNMFWLVKISNHRRQKPPQPVRQLHKRECTKIWTWGPQYSRQTKHARNFRQRTPQWESLQTIKKCLQVTHTAVKKLASGYQNGGLCTSFPAYTGITL